MRTASTPMIALPVLLAVAGLIVLSVSIRAQETIVDGAGAGVVLPAPRDCPGGELVVQHDGTFENAVSHDNSDHEPYFGAFGEGFDLGPGVIRCGSFWMTSLGAVSPAPTYVYVWEGGAQSAPGAVLAIVPDVVFDQVGLWPEIGRNDVPVDLEVEGAFTIGWWGGCGPPSSCSWLAADEDGPGGHPWGYVLGYGDVPDWWPLGTLYWTQSLGVGVWFEPAATPAWEASWGRIKTLYETPR